MEDNIQNQPEDISTDYVSPDDIDIDLDEDYKLDWNASQNEENDAIQERETEEVSLGERAGDSEEVDGSLRVDSDKGEDVDEGQSEEEGDLDYDGVELGQVQEYDDEEVSEEETSEEDDYEDGDYSEDVDDDDELPEDWQKLIDFMEEFPGATPADYVKMTSGGEGLSDEQILKMHLASENGLDVEEDAEELDFLYDDKFGFDEDLDSERDIKLKKIEAKKALRGAKENLSEVQLKYGADLKFGSENPELKDLQSFQAEQLELQKQSEELANGFQNATKDYFSKEFKGFEFNYGDGKSQRIKADPNKVANQQADITNFISKYTGEDGTISDLAGYHKALWAAQNADSLFSHAYEQGKADAVRSAARTAKNIDMDPRQGGSGDNQTQSKFKLVDDSSTDDFKINLNNY